MSLPQSSLIIKRYDGFGGNFLDSQYLGASYDAGKPHVFEGTLAKIYSSTSRFGYFTAKQMIGMTSSKADGVTEIDSEIWRWRLSDAEYRCGRSLELVETSVTPGINGTTFRFKLDIDWYQNPDVLMPEDNEFAIAIVDGPIADGTGFVYTGRLQTDRPDAFLNPKYLNPGRQFTRVWTSVASEMNDRFGTQQAPSTFLLESQLGFFAHKITVTDKAMREQGRLGISFLNTDSKGNTQKVDTFLPYYEAKMWEEFYMDMERQMVYGKRSHVDGPRGYWTKTGRLCQLAA